MSSLLYSFCFLELIIRSSILGSSSSEGSSINSLLGLLLGLLLGFPVLVKIPAPVLLGLGRGLVLSLFIALGITISKLFYISRIELIIGIDFLFLGRPAYLRSGRYNYILVINKFTELP